MAFLAAAAPWLSAAGTALTVISAVNEGQAQQQQMQAKSLALRNQANAQAASAERTAIVQRRQAQYQMSRVQALAASSGAGASDPNVVNTEGAIAGQGEWNALTTLYEGDTAEENDNAASAAASNAGRAAASAGVVKGISTLLSGGTSLATKYG